MKRASPARTPQAHSRLALALLVGAVLLVTGLAYLRENDASDGATTTRAAGLAPPFRAAALSGHVISFPDDYRGKLVLIDFWATWCLPCVGEIPHLRDAYAKFRDQGFEIIGISLDAPSGVPAETVRRFATKHDMPWEVIYEAAPQIAQSYGVTAIPVALLVDGDTGRVVAGPGQLRGSDMVATVARALRAKGKK
jgi:peroxiredoxin